jgi:tetratricopeptide (TPR) repeat protein
MNKNFAFAIFASLSLCGCGYQSISQKLRAIDSLVSDEKYDSAYYEVKKINTESIKSPDDSAHYYLLLYRSSMFIGSSFPPDSLIDYSISYYEKADNGEKLCDAYYYKAVAEVNKGKYNQAIVLSKQAEKWAKQINKPGELLKISELIAYINGVYGNNDLKLQYAKQSLKYAMEIGKKNWIVISYCRICEAYQAQEKIDSALMYADKIMENIHHADTTNIPYFLNTIGSAYLEKDINKAKKVFEKSLTYRPLARTYENLAYIYYIKGKGKEAYELWKQALLTDDSTPKDRILFNILQYDLEHHNVMDVSKQIYDIYAIKDSLNDALKDRSLLKIQQEFDKQVAHDQHEQELLRWGVAVLALIVIILLLIGYIQYRRHKAKLLLAEQQMIINYYMNEIRVLKNNQDGTEQQIADLNQKINDLIEQDSPRLYRGKMLYDHIMQNGTTVAWSKDDYQCFVDFYKANDLSTYNKIVKKDHPKTIHNTFFLILYAIGKTDKQVQTIMAITQEAIRSTRFRIKNNKKRG